MQYVAARLRQESDVRAYRFYISDALQMITENAASRDGQVRYLAQRYADVVDRTPDEQENDPRSCTEIVADMWAKLRGEEVDNGLI